MKTKDLQNIKLPLSQTDYEKLRKALWDGQIEWKDIPKELRYAYGDYGRAEREAKWELIKESEYD